MNKTLKITLVKPLIIESVKNETFQRGQFDKTDLRLTTAAYHEQAGDEPYHERMLQRSLYWSVASLQSYLAQYLADAFAVDGQDNVSKEEVEDTIIISVTVSERFNPANADPLAKLASEYVENAMLMNWWQPINEKLAASYAVSVERSLAGLKRCFNKLPPAPPQDPYPVYISLHNNFFRIKPGESCTITYATSQCKMDDIDIRIADHRVVKYEMHTAGGFIITGLREGYTEASLVSLHNPTVSAQIYIIVAEDKTE